MFTTGDVSTPDDLEQLVQREITDEENDRMTTVPTGEEIYQTLKSMNPQKAPGPDGLLGVFYKDCWDLVGDDVVASVQSFFTAGYLLKETNYTYVVLIPKHNQAVTSQDFRLISLCNLSYKLISKILANRMTLKRITSHNTIDLCPKEVDT